MESLWTFILSFFSKIIDFFVMWYFLRGDRQRGFHISQIFVRFIYKSPRFRHDHQTLHYQLCFLEKSFPLMLVISLFQHFVIIIEYKFVASRDMYISLAVIIHEIHLCNFINMSLFFFMALWYQTFLKSMR